MLTRPDGINLYGDDDDNANGAVNNTSRGIMNCQYHGGGGFCWIVPAYTRFDWTGWWRQDRDSWVRYTS
jgi:hypothetical protein